MPEDPDQLFPPSACREYPAAAAAIDWALAAQAQENALKVRVVLVLVISGVGLHLFAVRVVLGLVDFWGFVGLICCWRLCRRRVCMGMGNLKYLVYVVYVCVWQSNSFCLCLYHLVGLALCLLIRCL